MAKNKGGRPTDYKPEYCQMIIDHMAKGHSVRSFSASIDSHSDNIYEWAKKHPEFSGAIKRAKEKCATWWEKMGMAATAGQVKGFNPTAYVWMTKNILGWSDRLEVNKEFEPIVVKITGKKEKYSIE